MIMQILGCIHLAHTRSIEVRTQTKLSFVLQGLSAASFFFVADPSFPCDKNPGVTKPSDEIIYY